MIKKTIKYVDFNGVERTEDHYFNLTKAEITEMQLGVKGGLDKYIEEKVYENDTEAIIRIYKKLLLKAYGIKSEDGRRFIKSESISEEFSQTEAFSELFMELALNEQAAKEFMNNVMPSYSAH